MKHCTQLFGWLTAAVLTAGFVACSEQSPSEPPPSPPTPAVKIIPGNPTSTALTFTLEPTAAENLRYLVSPATSTPSSASDLLARGSEADPTASKEYTASDLQTDTEYRIEACAWSGEVAGEVVSVVMTTTPGSESAIEMVCPYSGGGFYYASDLSGGEYGQYSLHISTAELSAQGPISPGYEFQLSFHSDLAADPANAAPAPGTYKFDPQNTFEKFTCDAQYSAFRELGPGGEPLSVGSFTEGELVIGTNSGTGYEVTATLTTSDNKRLKITYTGDIVWKDMTQPEGDLELEALSAKASFYRFPTDTGDYWTIELFDTEDPANYNQEMWITLFSEHSNDPVNATIPVGIYLPDKAGERTPGTFHMGDASSGMPLGTLLRQLDPPANILCVDGSITITAVPEGYRVECNLISNESNAVTATYTGLIPIKNNYEPPLGDISVQCDRQLYGYYYGPTVGLQGDDVGIQYMISLSDVECVKDVMGTYVPVTGQSGNIVTINLYAENDELNSLQEGTYTGSLDAGKMLFDMMGTISYVYDQTGQSKPVSFSSGTLVVARQDDNYSLTLNAVISNGQADDSYTMTYTGPLTFEDKSGGMTSAAQSRRMSRIMDREVIPYGQNSYGLRR